MRINTTVFIFIFLWTYSIICTYIYQNQWFMVTPYFVFIVNELIYIFSGLDLFTAESRTEILYDLAALNTGSYNPNQKDDGYIEPNYSEGYYPNDDYTISPKQAEEYKFDKIIELLGAKKGDKILDMGCGMGMFERYCKKIGIEMTGVSLSSEQVEMAKAVGIQAVRWDFQKFNPDFVNKYDHIIWLGSSEHICYGPHHMMSSYEKKRDALTEMLEMVKQYFKTDAPKKRIFYSEIHINEAFMYSHEAYVLDRTYGGQYRLNKEGYDVTSSGLEAGYKVLYTRDATKDYYLATMLNKNHFGNPASFISKTALSLMALGIIYPFAWYMWYYDVCGLWMWMFDGNLHFYSDPKFTFKPMEERPVTLWWVVLDLQAGSATS